MKYTSIDGAPAMAEAIFGSAARGDADQMSDRDILVVDESVSKLRERSAYLTACGWSVAPYTFKKLGALVLNGALFIQHLKLESEIVADREGRLRQILDGFRPRACYTEELASNARLAELAASIPDAPNGPLYAADVLYVAIRNFGVLKLAERGTHCYSYREILAQLENERIVLPGAAAALEPLRNLKSLYRSAPSLDTGSAIDAVKLALEYLPAHDFPQAIEVVSAAETVGAGWDDEVSVPYIQLRDLEKRYVALSVLDPTARFDVEISRLARWIANPRTYAQWSARNAGSIRLRIKERLARYAGVHSIRAA